MAIIYPVLILHGGAGDIAAERHEAHHLGKLAALAAGWQVLDAGGSALDAVETAIIAMEADPTFNAGFGSVLTSAGEVEMDAGIMDGAHLEIGAVALIRHIAHPITLARRVMELTPHHFLAGAAAEAFAAAQGFPLIAAGTLVSERQKRSYEAHLAAQVDRQRQGDTVGALALDRHGHVAAANSTGGVSFKLPGRIGDSPLAGAGFYADDRFGAAACTGQGEHIMRVGLALRAVQMLERGLPAQAAAEAAIALLRERVPDGQAGLIVLDAQGRAGLAHSTPALSWGLQVAGEPRPLTGMRNP